MQIIVNKFGNICNAHTWEVLRHCANNSEIAAEIARRGYKLESDYRNSVALANDLRQRLGMALIGEAVTA